MSAAGAGQQFDPITFQVLWSRAVNIADEIAATLVKTAFSHVVRDNHDYACAIYDPAGRMLAQSNQCTPGQIGCMPRVMRDFLAEHPLPTLAPGDVLMTNDPWLGSGHTPDIYVATPIFIDGRVVGFAVTCAHHLDIGGRLSSPDAREVYEEGLIFPICKLYRAGEPNRDILRLLERNVRLPDKVIGDLRAQLAANHLGGRRVVEFLRETGMDDMEDLARAIIDHTAASMRDAIREVPDGVYRHALTLDETGRDGRPLRIEVSLEVAGDEVTVDFAGTSAQVDLPINSVLNITSAYTTFPLKCALHPHIPNNAGSSAPIRLVVPEGTILNAIYPVACMHRTSIVYYAVEAIFGALVRAIPEKVMAPSGTYPLWIGAFAGRFDDGRPFLQHFNAQGGQGARFDKDGATTTVFPPNVASTSVELLEFETPLLCEEKVLRPDSGGPGTRRGGLGQEAVIRNLARETVVASVVGGRFRAGAAGIEGGLAGATGAIRLDDGEPLARSSQVTLRHDQSVRLTYPGGGGFGDPRRREVELVLDDVLNGLVTSDAARAHYGVAVDADGSLDKAETARLRAAE